MVRSWESCSVSCHVTWQPAHKPTYIRNTCLAELTKEEVNVVPVTQSAYMQRNKLKYLLEKVDHLLGLDEMERSKKWTVRSMQNHNL